MATSTIKRSDFLPSYKKSFSSFYELLSNLPDSHWHIKHLWAITSYPDAPNDVSNDFFTIIAIGGGGTGIGYGKVFLINKAHMWLGTVNVTSKVVEWVKPF